MAICGPCRTADGEVRPEGVPASFGLLKLSHDRAERERLTRLSMSTSRSLPVVLGELIDLAIEAVQLRDANDGLGGSVGASGHLVEGDTRIATIPFISASNWDLGRDRLAELLNVSPRQSTRFQDRVQC